MKVKMKVWVSGTRNGAGDAEWPRIGGDIEVPDVEGAGLVASGMAVEVKVEKKPEPEKKAEPEPVVETAKADESKTETTALTTSTGPVKRSPGRPKKNA